MVRHFHNLCSVLPPAPPSSEKPHTPRSTQARHVLRDQRPVVYGLAGAALTAFLLWVTGLLGDAGPEAAAAPPPPREFNHTELVSRGGEDAPRFEGRKAQH